MHADQIHSLWGSVGDAIVCWHLAYDSAERASRANTHLPVSHVHLAPDVARQLLGFTMLGSLFTLIGAGLDEMKGRPVLPLSGALFWPATHVRRSLAWLPRPLPLPLPPALAPPGQRCS